MIRRFFEGINLSTILQDGSPIRSTLKGLTPLHEQVLQLLGIPDNVYRQLRDGWWNFAPS
ncbi:MAG: hypothetical protein U5S82_24090 [Gammaproteobacteria bacterium]|nr:hypothetical protein [Gammaproteobacteria bacterium]